jgi:hypothetical protein
MYDGQMVQGIKDEAVLSFINSKMPLFAVLKEQDKQYLLATFLKACSRRDKNTVKGVLSKVKSLI